MLDGILQPPDTHTQLLFPLAWFLELGACKIILFNRQRSGERGVNMGLKAVIL